MAHDDRRRIDEILAPGFLDRLKELSVIELKGKREKCQSVEEELSFRRRVLQGRIDIAKAERARRSGEAEGGLIEALPRILADQVSQRRAPTQARPSPVYVPGPQHTRRAEDADEAVLGRLPDLGDDELDALVERLSREEQAVSAHRRQVLECIDRVQEELVTRLRDNPHEISGLLDEDLADRRDDEPEHPEKPDEDE